MIEDPQLEVLNLLQCIMKRLLCLASYETQLKNEREIVMTIYRYNSCAGEVSGCDISPLISVLYEYGKPVDR